MSRRMVSGPLTAAVAFAALALGARGASAQPSIAERVRAAGTRTVAFTAPARTGVCGDGDHFLSDGLPPAWEWDGDPSERGWVRPPCVHGPVRITLRVVAGTPSRVRATAGPLPPLPDSVLDLGAASAAAAGAYLRELARAGEGRVAEQALFPLLLVDSVPRWEILAAATRDTTRLERYRRRAASLLARGAASTIGPADWSDDPAAQQRRAAVSALARRRDRDPDIVPQLIEIARTNRHPDVRAAAIRQLGQTADPRAIALFTALLKGTGT